ncbi:hypothetical protein BH23CHL2_BH23CHL2_27540 [soil metagenome]
MRFGLNPRSVMRVAMAGLLRECYLYAYPLFRQAVRAS